MNRNCCTNSVPYGYGGRSAETNVFPVRIIMSPTCSSRFLVGRKTRSAAALTTTELLPRENYPCSPENTYAKEAYGMGIGSARGNRTGASRRSSVVCSARFEGLERGSTELRTRQRRVLAHDAMPPCRDRRMRRRGAPGRERAGRALPGRGRRRGVPREAEAREELRARGHR